MDNQKPIHSGLLMLPPSTKLLLKKAWQQKFCILYKASKFGIERLEIYDSPDDATKCQSCPSKIITLENCVKVARKSPLFFTVITKSGSFEFSTASEAAGNEWIAALQSVAFPDDVSYLTTLVEDNDLYCSIGEGIFSVRLHETEASIRCHLLPKNYMLTLTSAAIQLRESVDDTLLYTWPYHFIRRYGYSTGTFTFEAGRKCKSGEGKFILEHSNEQEIFRYLTKQMKSMKKLLKSDSVSKLDCGDKQFQAMLNMEPRSRSPLLPSPTTSTSSSVKHIVESLTEKHNKEKFKPVPPIKPRRRDLQPKDDYEFVSKCEDKPKIDDWPTLYSLDEKLSVCKYDDMEIRNNAWETFGQAEVDHSENLEEFDDEVKWSRKSPVFVEKISNASKVITEPEAVYDYDRLNFFGSSSKLNVSGYKQIRSHSNLPPTPPSYNEYDEVHILECIRPADDSHLGYAVVRKKESQINHKSFNDTEYAVISKPKHV